MGRQVKTYKVSFIFFKLYKSVEVTAINVNEAENIICDRYLIPKKLKKDYHFRTTLVK
jgi:hypothetical protein